MKDHDIKYLVMDVDGTLTDGKIYIGKTGEFCKAFNVKDGCGIHDLLIPAGIIPIIMTGRRSRIIERRCIELGITSVYQGIADKSIKLNEILKDDGHSYTNVAYMGDDINDLSCMRLVKSENGLVGCPVDAVKQVREIADHVSDKKGGDGAVREFIEWLLKEDGHE